MGGRGVLLHVGGRACVLDRSRVCCQPLLAPRIVLVRHAAHAAGKSSYAAACWHAAVQLHRRLATPPLRLAACSDVAVCLVTGNLEPIGW